jgi:hypothetical protein
MKPKSLLLFVALCGGTMMAAQDIAPGINYSYNPPAADGIINDIAVDVLNNDNTSAGSFDVSMYLYDQSTSNYWVIGTTNIPSLSGNSMISITNWDIDINNTSGIPAGTYRLGIWVDSNDDISESDENNNTGLLSGNINYTPASSSGIASPVVASSMNCFPNPANAFVTLSFTQVENATVTVTVYDLAGQPVAKPVSNENLMPGQQTIRIETGNLSPGIYFIAVISGDMTVTQRIVISR